MRILIVSALCIVLSACATTYRPEGPSGGFSETELARNVWRVRFTGNVNTEKHRAKDLALLRSAELTLKNGYTHFRLNDSNSSIETSTFTIPSTSHAINSAYRNGDYIHGSPPTQTYGGPTILVSKPAITNTVVMFEEKLAPPGIIYDARFICGTLGEKYHVACLGK